MLFLAFACVGVLIWFLHHVEQDLEYTARRLVAVALRALSPGLNDPFAAIAVLDRLSAALCSLRGANWRMAASAAPGGCGWPGPLPTTPGCWTRRFACCASPAGPARGHDRLLEVLAGVASIERDLARRHEVRHHTGGLNT